MNLLLQIELDRRVRGQLQRIGDVDRDPELTLDRRHERDMSERVPARGAELAHTRHVSALGEAQHGPKHLCQLLFVFLCHLLMPPFRALRQTRRRLASATTGQGSWATSDPDRFPVPGTEGCPGLEPTPGSRAGGPSSVTACWRGARRLPNRGSEPPRPGSPGL